jgi:hypothetical protein
LLRHCSEILLGEIKHERGEPWELECVQQAREVVRIEVCQRQLRVVQNIISRSGKQLESMAG